MMYNVDDQKNTTSFPKQPFIQCFCSRAWIVSEHALHSKCMLCMVPWWSYVFFDFHAAGNMLATEIWLGAGLH